MSLLRRFAILAAALLTALGLTAAANLPAVASAASSPVIRTPSLAEFPQHADEIWVVTKTTAERKALLQSYSELPVATSPTVANAAEDLEWSIYKCAWTRLCPSAPKLVYLVGYTPQQAAVIEGDLTPFLPAAAIISLPDTSRSALFLFGRWIRWRTAGWRYGY